MQAIAPLAPASGAAVGGSSACQAHFGLKNGRSTVKIQFWYNLRAGLYFVVFAPKNHKIWEKWSKNGICIQEHMHVEGQKEAPPQPKAEKNRLHFCYKYAILSQRARCLKI